MKKAEWKERALRAELELRIGPPLVFSTFDICWSSRTVKWKGQTVTAGPSDCVSFPVATVANALEREGMA